MFDKVKLVKNFYLAGGTGLALHLGHRFSVDLDFFSERENTVGPGERAILRDVLNDPTLEIIHDKDSTFVANWRGVGVSFFHLNLYPLAQPTLSIGNINLASVEEIGAMKLAAIINRGTRKDMVDLYYILQKVSLDMLFQVAAESNMQRYALFPLMLRGLCLILMTPKPFLCRKCWIKPHGQK